MYLVCAFLCFSGCIENKRFKKNIIRYSGILTRPSVAEIQFIMWGKNMMALVVGWVDECCSELDTQLLFLSQTLKNVFVRIFQDAAKYKWGKNGHGVGWEWW